MRIAMNTGTLVGRYPIEEAMHLCKAAGFDSVDIAMNVLTQPGWEGDQCYEQAVKIRRLSEELDLPVLQTHAGGDKAKSAKVTALLGCPVMVIHPRIILPHVGYEDQNFVANMEFLATFAPLAEENNIKIAVENMFKWDLKREVINYSTCSTTAEFCRYMEGLHQRFGDLFGACVDVGHLALVGTDVGETIRALGDDLLALHVHDNDLHTDQHTIMGAGVIDFVQVSQALKDIRYQGAYALEVGLHFPKDLLPTTVKYLAQLCRYYADLATHKE